MSSLAYPRVLRAGAVFTASVLLASVVAAAQNPPLGEVARKEEERRKTTGPATRVLTNKDLPTVSSPAPAPVPADQRPVAGADAATLEPAAPETTKPDAPERDEAWWRTHITDAREGLRRGEVLLDALQARVNGLTSDFVGRDDPYQRARIGQDRQNAIAEMDRVRADVAGLKKKIEDLEEEARKAGVPPGWLR